MAGLSDASLIEIATEFRAGILDDAPSFRNCAVVALPLAGLLGFYGVEVRAVEGDLGDCNHVWLELPDGRVLDPTADQFNGRDGHDDLPPVYLGPALDIHPRNRGTQ